MAGGHNQYLRDGKPDRAASGTMKLSSLSIGMSDEKFVENEQDKKLNRKLER